MQSLKPVSRHTRRRLLAGLALGATAGQLPLALAGANYPDRPVTIVLPFPPGGVADLVGRRISERLGTLWGQTVVLHNRPGAGGNLGAAQVAKAPADGHTLLVTVYDGIVIAKAFDLNVGYDATRDLAPVALATLSTTVIIANPALPVSDFQGFLDYAKAHPGRLNFGSNGTGSSYHLALEQLNASAGTQIQHVPYKGSGQVMTDLVAGRLDATITTVFLAKPYIDDGRVKPLAIGSAQRSSLLPEVPTVAESGIAGYDASVGMGVYAPAGVPQPLISQLNAAIREVMQDVQLQAQLEKEGTRATDLTAPQFAQRMEKEIAQLRALKAQRNLVIES